MAVALMLAGCSGGGERADSAVLASVPEYLVATPTPPAAEEILRLSDAAMADAGYVVTARYDWERDGRLLQNDYIWVEETYGTRNQVLAPTEIGVQCRPGEFRVPRFARRSEGALALYGAHTGATGIEEVELLGDEVYQGTDAWVIRFRYLLPSWEGPFPIEHTEWIAKEDYRLLRQELEQFDPYGFVGQRVVLFLEYRDEPAECPARSWPTREKMRPLTTPRLENPYRYR